jgi:PAS domain S-box-containing protein
MTESPCILYVSAGTGDAAAVADAFDGEFADASVETTDDVGSVETTVDEAGVDCVVSTHDPPEVDALAVLDRLRDAHPTLPFVLFADTSESTVRELYARRGTAFVRRDGDSGCVALAAEVSKLVAPPGPGDPPRDVDQVYQALETSDQGISLLDDDGEFVYVNEAYAALYGYDREEMIGSHRSMLYREEDVTQVEEEILPQVAEEGQWRGETVGVRRDDEQFVEDHSLAHTSDGGLVCIVRDVTDRKHLQAELDEALDRITDAFYALNKAWRFTYVNERAEETLGRDADEIIGNSVWEEFPGLAGTTIEEKYREAMKRQESVQFEEFYEPHDAWHRIHAHPSDTGLSVYFEDVTDEKEMEAALASERDLRERIIETSPVGICILDEDREFEYMNERAEEILGRTKADLAGYADDIGALEPQNEEAEPLRGETPFEQIAETEEPLYDFRVSVVRPDGERVWLSVNGAPLFDDDELTKVLITLEDVTDTVLAREELESEKDRFRRMVEDVEDYAIFMLDPEGHVRSWNAGAEQIKGYTEEEILGEHFSTFYPEEYAEDGLPDRMLAEAAETGRATHEGWRVRKDGTRFWGFVVLTALYGDGDDLKGFTKVTRDMTERKRREEQLTELNDLSRDLLKAETADEISDLAVTAGKTILDCPVVCISLYDAEAGALEPAAQTPEASEVTDGGFVSDDGRRFEWNAFVENETKRYDELPDGVASESDLLGGFVVPLGRHGVLAVGATAPGDLAESTVEIAEVLASTVTAALDRTDREREVREHERSLEEKNEALERLNHINEVVRGIDRALVGATTRVEIEEAVCAELADADPYCFAWIGATSGATNEVRPRQWAGMENSYLDEVDHAPGGPEAEQPPAVRALRTRETQTEPNLLTEPPFEPWRQAALSREYRSAVSIPLEYAGSLYGVVSVYADDAGVFDEMERQVLDELGDTIAHAINAVESKKALVSDSVVELEFRLRDPDLVLTRAVSEGGGRFEFEGIVPNEGYGRLFFTVTGMDSEEVTEYIDPAPEVKDLGLVAERGDRYLYEVSLTEQSFTRTLIDHGAVPREIISEDDEVRLAVDLSVDADVRQFVEMMQSRYRDVELVGRRERERSVQTRDSFRAEVSDLLTDRQEEVLRTAYLSGFFETPRDRTGGEVAGSLDVSQPTFNNHLRAAQRKLFTLLFEDEF